MLYKYLILFSNKLSPFARILIILTSTMFKPEEPSKDPKPEEHKEDEEDDEDEDVEKEVVGNWKIVDLPEIPVVTGEEQEEELAKFRSKIYRFRKQEWKERGVGELRFLKHKVTHMIRILSRAEKTHKCTINHFPIRQDILGQLEKLKTSNNTWSWAAQDISD
jgi:Ran-binding protein 1